MTKKQEAVAALGDLGQDSHDPGVELSAEKEGFQRFPHQSHEASFLVFTTFIDPFGAIWHLTIREGYDLAEVQQLLKDTQLISGSLVASRDWRAIKDGRDVISAPLHPAALGPPSSSGNAGPPRQTAAVSALPKKREERVGWDSRKSPVAVAKILVTGEDTYPLLQMYSPNPKLEYPVVSPPAALVCAILEAKYGLTKAQLTSLMSPGKKISGKKWLVAWVQSPKNPKWKDVVDIIIPKLAGQEQEWDFETLEWGGPPSDDDKPGLTGVDNIPF